MNSTQPAKSPNYEVKSVQPIMVGSDMQARLFTLAPGDTVPWHRHTKTSDHYFVLEGVLTILTEGVKEVSVGGDYKITPGTRHQITNRSAADCRFLQLQGVGPFDWIKADN
jgi:quercetin dioxygenase-like cupin family protein